MLKRLERVTAWSSASQTREDKRARVVKLTPEGFVFWNAICKQRDLQFYDQAVSKLFDDWVALRLNTRNTTSCKRQLLQVRLRPGARAAKRQSSALILAFRPLAARKRYRTTFAHDFVRQVATVLFALIEQVACQTQRGYSPVPSVWLRNNCSRSGVTTIRPSATAFVSSTRTRRASSRMARVVGRCRNKPT